MKTLFTHFPHNLVRFGFTMIVMSVVGLTACSSSSDTASAPAPPVNTAPTISGTPPTSVTINQSYSFVPTAADGNGDALTFSIVNGPSWSSFNTATGELSGTPAAADIGNYQAITISVSDGSAQTSLAPFDIAVVSNNSPPTISGTPTTSVAVNQAYSFVPTANDPDGDSLTFSIVNLPTWASFDNSTGELSGTPGAADIGNYQAIIISVGDGSAQTSLAAFDITVFSGNRPPTISGTPTVSVAVNQAYSFVPTANDPDGDPLTFSIVGLPAWASFNNATGELSGTPGAADAGNYPAISITVSDDSIAQASLPPFDITVFAGNSPPTISGTPASSAVVNQAYSFVPTASDFEGDPLTFSILNQPSWAGFDTATGELSGTPGAAAIGNYPAISITVSDGTTPASLPPFDIEVVAVNTPPVISGTPATTVVVGEAYSFIPTASDADGDTLTFSIANQPSWAGFDTATGTLSGTPAAAAIGDYQAISITVSDGMAQTSLPAFDVAVVAANTPPVISGTPATSIVVGQAYSFVPTASDADGDTLTFSIANQPSWAGFDTATGTLSGTPAAGDVAIYQAIVITVSDGQSNAALPAFDIDVMAITTFSVRLTWTPPTLSADGSPLNDLAFYRVKWGIQSGNHTNSRDILDSSATGATIDSLVPGTYFFVVTAVDTSDNESILSNEATTAVP